MKSRRRIDVQCYSNNIYFIDTLSYKMSDINLYLQVEDNTLVLNSEHLLQQSVF
jgi:hypothetical protein